MNCWKSYGRALIREMPFSMSPMCVARQEFQAEETISASPRSIAAGKIEQDSIHLLALQRWPELGHEDGPDLAIRNLHVLLEVQCGRDFAQPVAGSHSRTRPPRSRGGPLSSVEGPEARADSWTGDQIAGRTVGCARVAATSRGRRVLLKWPFCSHEGLRGLW